MAQLPSPRPPVILKMGPIEYFEASCARCHGPNGSNYGPQFGRKLGEAALRKVVKEMAEGPGGWPLEGIELEAQIAYHRALIRKEPFLSLTKLTGKVIGGEIYPEGPVQIRGSGAPIRARVKLGRWEADLPKGADPKRLFVTSGKTVLSVAKTPFSSANPIPPR